MIKTRLIGLVPESKKYIFCNVFLQWLGMLSSVAFILTIAQLFGSLQNGAELACAASFTIILIAIVMRIACLKLAASASFYQCSLGCTGGKGEAAKGCGRNQYGSDWRHS